MGPLHAGWPPLHAIWIIHRIREAAATCRLARESLRLASRAVVARSILNSQQLNFGTAPQAKVPLVGVGGIAAFNADTTWDVEFRSFDGDDATVLDSFAQHCGDRDPECLQLGDVQLDAWVEWVNAADEECFSAVHIADSSDD